MSVFSRKRVTLDASQSMHANLSRGHMIMIMAGIMLAMLLSALDQTVVGTALPRVIADLNGLEHYAWVFTAYMLASTVTVPIYGKLSDVYGRRPFFLIGMVLFLLGSALSGTSQSMEQLIIYRAIQGLVAGAMMPITQSIVGDIFPPAQRGKWMGLMMAVFGLAAIVGPTAGGWITDNWGWRWIFYVNMPVGAIALLTVGLTLPSLGQRKEHRIDYLGAAILVAAAGPMLLAFSWAGSQYDWISVQVIGLLVFAAIMFVVFFLWEGRAAEPVITPGLFRNGIFSVSVLSSFLVSAGMFGAIMYLPLFVQGVLGQTATNSGAVLTPMMLGLMVTSIVSGQLMSRWGRYKILAIVGFTITCVGMFFLSRVGVGTGSTVVVWDMVILGLGMGVGMTLFTIVAQNAFPFRQIGEVTASLTFFRSIGGTVGVAILGSIMTNGFHSAFQSNLPQILKQTVPPDQLAQLDNPQVLLAPQVMEKLQASFAAYGAQGQAMFQQLVEAIRQSLATSIANVFAVGLVLMILATISCFFLKEIPLRKSHVETEEVDTSEASIPSDAGLFVS
jgi:EmrB/QacA subfamily drug resistance transporter